jgi:hypothetical protein
LEEFLEKRFFYTLSIYTSPHPRVSFVQGKVVLSLMASSSPHKTSEKMEDPIWKEKKERKKER